MVTNDRSIEEKGDYSPAYSSSFLILTKADDMWAFKLDSTSLVKTFVQLFKVKKLQGLKII